MRYIHYQCNSFPCTVGGHPNQTTFLKLPSTEDALLAHARETHRTQTHSLSSTAQKCTVPDTSTEGANMKASSMGTRESMFEQHDCVHKVHPKRARTKPAHEI